MISIFNKNFIKYFLSKNRHIENYKKEHIS